MQILYFQVSEYMHFNFLSTINLPFRDPPMTWHSLWEEFNFFPFNFQYQLHGSCHYYEIISWL